MGEIFLPHNILNMKNKKIICLDIDGVIADIQPELELRLEKDFNITLPTSQWDTYVVSKQFPEVPEKWVNEQFADPIFYLNSKCRKDAWFMVNKWFMCGHDVFLVTCRGPQYGPKTVSNTEKWLNEWELNYNKLFHSETRLEKWKTCLKLNANLFVEDDAHEAKIASQHIPTFLMNHNYNQNYDIGFSTRIDSLYDLDKSIVPDEKEEL